MQTAGKVMFFFHLPKLGFLIILGCTEHGDQVSSCWLGVRWNPLHVSAPWLGQNRHGRASSKYSLISCPGTALIEFFLVIYFFNRDFCFLASPHPHRKTCLYNAVQFDSTTNCRLQNNHKVEETVSLWVGLCAVWCPVCLQLHTYIHLKSKFWLTYYLFLLCCC